MAGENSADLQMSQLAEENRRGVLVVAEAVYQPCDLEPGHRTQASIDMLKREEIRERAEWIARGESGALPWPPEARVEGMERPDERWLCELELAGG